MKNAIIKRRTFVAEGCHIKKPGDYPRPFDGPLWEPGCRRKTSSLLMGPFAKVHVGGKTSTLRNRPLRENHWLYNAVCLTGAIYTTKRKPGGTTQLPMACSHEQASAEGHPSARDSQLPKEDRIGSSTSAHRVSNNHVLATTRHIPCESRQAFLPQIDTRHTWPGRSLRTDSRSVLPSEILLRMREAVPVEPFGRAMFHCGMALGLNPQAAELLSKGGRDLAPYRRSLVGWRPLYAFRSHTVIHFDHSPRASLSNTLLQQMLLNLPFMAVKVCLLVMEDKRDEIGPRTSLVSGFVNEDREFSHRANPPIYKKCRGTTPGSWRPPLSRRQHLYSTGKDQSSRGVCFSDNSKIQISGIYGRSAA